MLGRLDWIFFHVFEERQEMQDEPFLEQNGGVKRLTYRRVSLNSIVSAFFCHTEFFSSISTLLTSQQSSHGSILHFQLMLSSLPISVDLIEAAEFADWSARIVLILRILSNVMSIHLRSVLGR